MGVDIERRRRSEVVVSVIGAALSAAAGVLAVILPAASPGGSRADSLTAAATVLVTISAIAVADQLARLGLTAGRRERGRAEASRMAIRVWQATLSAHEAGPTISGPQRMVNAVQRKALAWSGRAKAAGDRTLQAGAEALFAEAERVAARADAGTGSAGQVETAARHLRLGKRSTLFADLATSSGLTIFGLAGGGLISVTLNGDPSRAGEWWLVVTLALGALSAGARTSARAMAR